MTVPIASPRRRGRALAIPALLGALLLAMLTSAAISPAVGLGYSPQVDALSPYEGQVTCTAGPQPGTVALASWLMRHYPVTGSLGMMRACSTPGQSEHKDGRAFDWAADAGQPATRAAAMDFIHKILATDAGGNRFALARRMGIMYFIYRDKIWSSYRDFVPRPYLAAGCPDVQHCSRTLRHLNHVHISLGYAGAAAQTSWYRARKVPSNPVLFPGTYELNPDETAVTALSVPANGATASSPFLLKAGTTYRIVVTGTVRLGSRTVDANCVPVAGALVPTARGLLIDPLTGLAITPARLADWGNPGGYGGGGGGGYGGGGYGGGVGSSHAASPYASPAAGTAGLLLHGALRWAATSCQANHTYEAWYTPAATERLRLRYLSRTPATGTFRAFVARDDITTSSLAGH